MLFIKEFQSSTSLPEIAKEHGRSRGAIQAKLAALGFMDNPYLFKK